MEGPASEPTSLGFGVGCGKKWGACMGVALPASWADVPDSSTLVNPRSGPSDRAAGPHFGHMHSVAYGQKVVVDQIVNRCGYGHIRRHDCGLLQGQPRRQDRFPLGSTDAVMG